MDVITGKTRPTRGKAWFGETLDLTRLSEVQIAQAGIGRKFQKPTVFEALSVFENLELAYRTDKSVWACLGARLGGEQQIASPRCWTPFAWPARPDARPGCCPTARSSSWRSACCWCSSRNCCCSTNRWQA